VRDVRRRSALILDGQRHRGDQVDEIVERDVGADDTAGLRLRKQCRAHLADCRAAWRAALQHHADRGRQAAVDVDVHDQPFDIGA